MSAGWLAPLRALNGRALARRFAAGRAVDPGALGDARFRGVALGLPAIIERGAWSLFAKDVIVDDDGGLRGWNVRLAQPPARDPTTLATATLQPRRAGAGPRLFAPFAVTAGDRGDGRTTCLLDYRATHRAPPWSWLVDPLVQIDDDSDNRDDGGALLLLGVSRLQVGRWSRATPTWFVLHKEGPVPDDARAAARVWSPRTRAHPLPRTGRAATDAP